LLISRPAAVGAVSEAPFYGAVGDEVQVFRATARRSLPVLKGPTGCGKTRVVEAMAHQLGRDLITVAGHDRRAEITARTRFPSGNIFSPGGIIVLRCVPARGFVGAIGLAQALS
jgi:AAA domain (dynein-related subfamily)